MKDDDFLTLEEAAWLMRDPLGVDIAPRKLLLYAIRRFPRTVRLRPIDREKPGDEDAFFEGASELVGFNRNWDFWRPMVKQLRCRLWVNKDNFCGCKPGWCRLVGGPAISLNELTDVMNVCWRDEEER